MYNKKSVYALNKHDAEAIVYPSAEGETVRLTRQDFNSDTELQLRPSTDLRGNSAEPVLYDFAELGQPCHRRPALRPSDRGTRIMRSGPGIRKTCAEHSMIFLFPGNTEYRR